MTPDLPDLFAHFAERPRVMVATPTREGGIIDAQTAMLDNLSMACAHQGVEMIRATLRGWSLVAPVRNRITHDFLQTKCTHLLLVDDDIACTPGDALALLASGFPLVGLPCSRKTQDKAAMVDAVLSFPEHFRAHPEDIDAAGAVYNFAWPAGGEVRVEGGYAIVEHVGTGCLLIAREVIEAVAETAPRGYVLSTDGADVLVPWVWDTGLDGTLYRGEDVRFCRRAGELGYPTRILVSAKTAHYGLFPYQCNVLADLQRAKAKQERAEARSEVRLMTLSSIRATSSLTPTEAAEFDRRMNERDQLRAGGAT